MTGKHNIRAAYTKIPDQIFAEKIESAHEIIRDCTLCPRACHIDRISGEQGFCRTGPDPFVSSWGPHFGEEQPLVGRFGSGTIFFGNCNLGCIFCQNYGISHLGEGSVVSPERLSRIMLDLQNSGCHNINLVTPTHQVPAILSAIRSAVSIGLIIPIVYNCGGYESVQALEILDGIVDIYMPDFKYWDSEYAARYSDAADYPAVAQEAIREMHRQVGDLQISDHGVATRGLLVRHLVLPQAIAGTAGIVRFIADEISLNTYINIMDQYHPCFKAFDVPPLDRRITGSEYSDAINLAIRAGLKRIDGVTL